MSKYRSQKWYAAKAYKHDSERNSKIDCCLGTICRWCPHGAIHVSRMAHSSFAGKSMPKSTGVPGSSQRMVLRNSLLGTYVAEHIQLLFVFSPHTFFLSACVVETRAILGARRFSEILFVAYVFKSATRTAGPFTCWYTHATGSRSMESPPGCRRWTRTIMVRDIPPLRLRSGKLICAGR